ncbi:MAG: hypothetical protein JWP57_55 [Spirosoma sp.]|nr:hypothetical protein [Spirosoma sp.]
MQSKVGSFLKLLKQAFTNLKSNDPVRMAGATAFFSLFALPPIIIILSQVLSTLFNDHKRLVSGRLFGQLAELFGTQSARQLQDMSRHLQPEASYSVSTGLSVFLLLLASTTLFAVIKNSLNQLWNIKSERTFLQMLKDRGISLLIITASGLLFTVSLTIDDLIHSLSVMTQPALSGSGWLLSLGYLLASVVFLTAWFALLLRYLPDVRVRWQAVWMGAFVTSVLSSLGAELLSLLLTHQQISSLYGDSASLILILLFVFYCSLIFYYGASFTRQYTQYVHLVAEPHANAVAYTITEVDDGTDR